MQYKLIFMVQSQFSKRMSLIIIFSADAEPFYNSCFSEVLEYVICKIHCLCVVIS